MAPEGGGERIAREAGAVSERAEPLRRGEAREREAEARLAEAPRGPRLVREDAGSGARRGAAEAQAKLRRRRERAETLRAGDARAAAGEIPGLAQIGVELALGAMRLARTLATAPIRIGLAFLRPRER